jgi:E3 ubiquitin-protein ligase SIAH1
MYDIIKCPVCYDLLKPPIYQCDRGHHLCKQCHQKLRLEECPLCKAYFYGTRNFLAEDMIEKLQGLNVSQQTNLMQNLKRDARTVSHPSFCRGKFPCVFKSCKTEHPVGRMLPHIRYHHPTMLSEVRCKVC